jgi:hypothetical protein
MRAAAVDLTPESSTQIRTATLIFTWLLSATSLASGELAGCSAEPWAWVKQHPIQTVFSGQCRVKAGGMSAAESAIPA